MWSQFTNVTDRQTDRQTTCDRNTALCTKVHRAVKMKQYIVEVWLSPWRQSCTKMYTSDGKLSWNRWVLHNKSYTTDCHHLLKWFCHYFGGKSSDFDCTGQEIGWEDFLWNYLWPMWNVKPYPNHYWSTTLIEFGALKRNNYIIYRYDDTYVICDRSRFWP